MGGRWQPLKNLLARHRAQPSRLPGTSKACSNVTFVGLSSIRTSPTSPRARVHRVSVDSVAERGLRELRMQHPADLRGASGVISEDPGGIAENHRLLRADLDQGARPVRESMAVGAMRLSGAMWSAHAQRRHRRGDVSGARTEGSRDGHVLDAPPAPRLRPETVRGRGPRRGTDAGRPGVGARAAASRQDPERGGRRSQEESSRRQADEGGWRGAVGRRRQDPQQTPDADLGERAPQVAVEEVADRLRRSRLRLPGPRHRRIRPGRWPGWW